MHAEAPHRVTAQQEHVKRWLPGEKFIHHHSQRPCINGGLRKDALLAGAPRMYGLRGCVPQSEALGCLLVKLGRAAKVDEGPLVFAWQPHHVGRLEVAVRIACVMHGLQPLCDVGEHLQIVDTEALPDVV